MEIALAAIPILGIIAWVAGWASGRTLLALIGANLLLLPLAVLAFAVAGNCDTECGTSNSGAVALGLAAAALLVTTVVYAVRTRDRESAGDGS